MSLLIYLSLLNVGLGFSCGVWLRLRNLHVHRHLRAGYDLQKLSPPSRIRSLLRRLGHNVNVALVCQRLGAEPIPEISDGPQQEAVDPADLPVECRELAVSESANAHSDDATQSRAFGPHLPDCDTAVKYLSEDTATSREVRCLEPLAEKYGATESLNSQASENVDPKVLEANPRTVQPNATMLEPHRLSAGFQSPVQDTPSDPDASIDSNDSPRERYEPDKMIERDFLQRAAWIDQCLRTVLEQNDQPDEAALRQMASQVAATHQWWTQFEGSISKLLGEHAKQATSRDQRAQVDDDLIAMQACLVECQALIGEAGLGGEPTENNSLASVKTSSELPRKMRSRMMQATKACHRLRDNLVLMMPDSPLKFGETSSSSGDANPNHQVMTTKPLSFVADYGLRGLTEVIGQWRQEVHAGATRVASLILIDIDKTGQWNDELGLETVDLALNVCHEQIAECLRSNRGYDRVVRVSGQQFVVFLGGTNPHAARFAAERIRQAFANTTWQATDQEFVLNISAALCDYQEPTSIQAHITKLRQGLPEAKRVGGNAVVSEMSPGRFQLVTGIPQYSLPDRHHDQLAEKWNPKAEMTCSGS